MFSHIKLNHSLFWSGLKPPLLVYLVCLVQGKFHTSKFSSDQTELKQHRWENVELFRTTSDDFKALNIYKIVFSQNVSYYHEKRLFNLQEKQDRYRPADEGQFRVGKADRRILVTGAKKGEKRRKEKNRAQQKARKSANGDSFSLEHCLDINT